MGAASQISTEKAYSTAGTDIIAHEWERYPLNLTGYDAAEVDLGVYHARLHERISLLVEEPTKIQALSIKHSINSGGVKILQESIELKSLVELDNYLTGISQSTFTFFSIRPIFSWGALLISEEALKKLLSHLRVHPGFLDILLTFGTKTLEQDLDFGSYTQHITKDTHVGSNSSLPTAFELCYNLKYAQQIQDASDRTIWVMENMGVYSKYDYISDSTAWILLHPSPYFSRRLEEVFSTDTKTDGQRKRHDFDIHLLILRCAGHNWVPYINHLEEKFNKMDHKAFVEFEDAQRVQTLKNNFIQLSNCLDINFGLISSLMQGLKRFRDEGQSSYADEAEFTKCDSSLNLLLLQTSQHKIRVENLIRRTDGLFTLVPFMFAQRENMFMMKLSQEGTQHARSMKVITIFTMIYLPPSLVAGFFGIPFLSWDSNGDMNLASQSYYYFIATAILMALTFGIWWVWERKAIKIKERSIDEEQW